MGAFNRALEREYRVTGAQLAILRIVAEWGGAGGEVRLADLRSRLVMHPATLGQLLDRLAERGFVTMVADPTDRRRRLVRLTREGIGTVRAAPVAGPVRLRYAQAEPHRLRRLTAAFKDATVLFGLEEYADARP